MACEPLLQIPEIEAVRECALGAVHAEDALLREVIEYVDLMGGKMLRSRLMLLMAQALGSIEMHTISMAAAVELIHAATLVHDDVIDRATLRRGQASVNARYGDDVAILLADFLFARAFDLGLSTECIESLRILSQSMRTMCEGEMYQIEKRGEVLTEGEYLRIVDAKTASLFAASAQIGGILAHRSPEVCEDLRLFGLNLGTAFQIVDDILDYTGNDASLGKSIGSDMIQGKETLPLIHAYASATPEEQQSVAELLANGCSLDHILPIVRKYHGIDYATGRASEYSDRAQAVLARIDGLSERLQVESLCRFIIERNN